MPLFTVSSAAMRSSLSATTSYDNDDGDSITSCPLPLSSSFRRNSSRCSSSVESKVATAWRLVDVVVVASLARRNDLSIDGRAAARCSDQRFISDRTTLFASGPRIINGSPSRRASVGQIVHSATCFVSANSRFSRRRPDSKAKLPDDDRALRSSGSQFTSPHENGEDLVHQTHKPSKINCNRRFVYAGRPAST